MALLTHSNFPVYPPLKLIITAVTLLLFSHFANAQKTTTYTYDNLGRLTFVTDSVNGNRDYDYDRVGNRTLVAVNTATDAAAEPTQQPQLPGPTGLMCTQAYQGVWRGAWNPVAGAHHYIYGYLTSNGTFESSLSSTSIDINGGTCKWVQACYANNQCSTKVSFTASSSSSRSSVSSQPRSSTAASSVAPQLPGPTGLSCTQVYPGVYRASWNQVTGAQYYTYGYMTSNGTFEATLSGTSIDKSGTCKWVQACDSANRCSTKVSF